MNTRFFATVLGILTASVIAKAAPTATEAAHANNEFGVGLFNKVSKETAKGNKFVSPISAYLALSMLYNGAQKETQVEMAKMLASTGVKVDDFNTANRQLINSIRSDKDFTLTIANSLWAKKDFALRADFLDTAKQIYDAQATTLDFALPTASKTINDWVLKNTHDKIDLIVPPVLPPDAVLYLINAVYFEAKWQQEFSPVRTRNADFKLASGKTVQVPTMQSGSRSRFRTLVTKDGSSAIELPYKGNSVNMVVILPPQKEKPTALLARVGNKGLESVVAELAKAKVGPVNLQLPKIDFAYEENLNSSLQALGMKRAFSPTSAQLKGLSDDKKGNEYVSNVKQKAFVQVDEEGTKAGAATSIEVSTESAVAEIPVPFIVDRPYLFALVEKKTGAFLFLGSINEPEGGKLPDLKNK